MLISNPEIQFTTLQSKNQRIQIGLRRIAALDLNFLRREIQIERAGGPLQRPEFCREVPLSKSSLKKMKIPNSTNDFFLRFKI